MEGKKQSSSSSSSFTNELFGSKESSSSASSSSSGLFNSIFPPPSKAYGNDYISSEFIQKNHDYCATKSDTGNKFDDKISKKPNMDMSAFYDQDTSHPCHLSSSIYYGGQDIYPSPHATNNTPGHYPSTYNKDGEDDGRASRGNWWQGSLYY
ncbi:uncharacterized protein [Rutidosis leptorrhynchoides]|uniref:uncharacterized protein n=1 Tax=Rutidosis leptorrhynchoides TaxID=125765 RepID=UPI003A9A47C8